MRKVLVIFAFIGLSISSGFAQTGPGGVGNATGASSQPRNVLWLKSDAGVTSSSSLVDSWADQSGNGNNATGSGATRPTYIASDANFNNFPSISFPNTASSAFFLQVPDNDNLDNTSTLSVIFVMRPTSNTPNTNLGLISKRTSSGVDQSYYFDITNAHRYRVTVGTGSTANLAGANSSLSQNDILSFTMNGSTKTGYLDGTVNGTPPSTSNSISNNTSNLFIGSYNSADNNGLEGQLVEVIVFQAELNAAQRQIIENYLSAKYNTTLAAGDVYAGDDSGNSNHDFEMAGIGQVSGTQHVLANSAGLILSPSSGTLDTNGEFVLAGHNGVSNTVSVSNLGTGVQQRWARTWYIDKTPGTGIDVNIAFDFSDGIAGQFPQNKDNYVLLRYDGTNYQIVSGVTSSDKTIVGDQITFRVADGVLTDGIYTLGTADATNSPVNGVSNRTWYSYQSGNWTSSTSWTLDGGLFPLLVNPSNETPSSIDNVVITSGRTITMNTNNVQVNSMQVTGVLDLVATSGHNFVSISGSGRIKLASSTDNFPSGTSTSFADATVGGTVEINGTGMVLNQNRTFNNLIVNSTNATDLVTLLNDVTLNGSLTVSKGLFKFNNDAANATRTFTVNGNVTIESSGGMRTGTTNNRHEFNLYGNFTNDGGTAYFTQRTDDSQRTAAEATDGIVDFNLVSASQDQQISCNGVTRFYRVEINKGVDDTYKAAITASAASNFVLCGKANYDINGSSGSNDNAIGLINGTFEVGTNVSIPHLNTTGNYSIFETCQLWVNGGSVTKSGGTAIVPYGRVRVSAGTLTANINSGITLRDNGAIIVSGGTVNVDAIRTSTNGAGAVGSYIQSGGDVTLAGGGVSADYAVFSLTYTGNVFSMSGGTLTIKNRTGLGTSSLRGAIFINSDPANISVTGGTVIMEGNNTTDYRITSRAPFWNVTMRATGGARTLQLAGTTSGTGGGINELALVAQPLVVYNDLTIENQATFLTNNENVTIGGNFEIQNGGTYTYGTNTTTINGAGVSSLIFGNTTATQQFNNLVINKTSATDEAAVTTGRASPNAAVQVNGTLTVTNGTFDYSTFRVSARTTVTLASGVTVGKSSSTGRLMMDGTVDQILSSAGASVYNLEINNTDATPQVSISTGNLTVLGTLTLTAGILDINTRKLTLSGASASISGSGFGTTKMIQLAGNAGDGGLEMYFDANEAITYPIGTNANSTVRYTPVVAQMQSFSDDGLIRIAIEDRLLQMANLPATNSLSYNWRVSNSNFTTLPLISYQFSYAQSDADGSEGGYVPGKVLTTSPFTRSSEDGSDINSTTNVITFNGSSTGGAFPGTGFTLDNAAYTTGASGMFNGTPQVFYNRANGVTGWEDNNKWSLDGFNGTATNQSPAEGDVVLMNNFGGTNESWVEMDVDVEVAAIIFSNTGGGWLPRITVTNGRTVSLGVVSGTGELMVEVNPALPTLNNTDIGDFARQTLSMFIYKVENDATYTMYSAFTEYPNLRIEGNDGSNNGGLRVMRNTSAVTINRDLWMDWGGTFRAEANVSIVRHMRPGAGGGGGGRFQFAESGSFTVTVGSDIISSNSANNRIEVLNTSPATRLHTLKVGGNITLTTGLIDLYNGTGTANNAVLELNTTTIGSFTNSSGNTPDLFRLTMNKGTSIASTFTLSDNVTLNGPFNTTTKPLVLSNGLLILDDPAISFTLTSGGADFNIPAAAGLEVKQGTVATNTTSTSANVTLDGLLRISGGTVDINGGGTTDTNYIEYSNSGSAAIEISSGSLTVAGQLRRQLTSTTGILKYTQTGGTVLLGNESASTTTRGVFEVTNSGSQFNHSGGSLTLVRGINSTSVPSLLLEPSSTSITSGSTITIGNSSTPSGVNSQNIGIQSTATLNNLTIAGSNSPVVKVYISPLTASGNVTVSASTTLDGNGQTISIGGNFTVDGSYVPNNNTTIFTNTTPASVSGATALFNFYNVTKTGAGTLTLAKDITINKDLVVSAGTFATSTFTVTLKGNARVDGTISGTSGNGIVFSGSAQQQLTRSSSGTSTLGIVTISNTNGVVIPDGNGYNFDLTGNLRLQQGVLDIGGSLLFLQTNALIIPVNAFSVTNMIQTNSSFTDKGVKKQFPTGYTTDFVFPVGQLSYTPVTFNFSSPTNTTGTTGTPTITVRPANERHPSVVDDNGVGELPTPAAFNDLNNVLQYFWIVNADNVASTFKSTMTLTYTQSLVSVVSPYTEADYLAARILSDANPTNLINKFTTAEVDETANTITYSFSGVTDAGISADYFAGVDVAIPDNVPIYTTNASGNVSAAIYTPAVPGGGAPRGATVIVRAGDNLTLDTGSGSVSFYETQINSGATLTVPTGSIGHRLGTMSGTGDLKIESNSSSAVLPAADYSTFFSCSGGGLIYDGSGSYEILGGITSLRNLTLLGSNNKTLGNNDVTICNDLTLNGPTLDANNRLITVQNDFLLVSGIYNTTSSGGTLTITRDLTQTAGTFNGGSSGTKTIGRNLTVNGGTFTPGSGTSNVIRVNGNMTVAGGATITTGSGGATGQKFLFGGTTAQTLTGTFTSTRAFNRLELSNSAGLVLGGNTTVTSELLLTNGLLSPSTNTLLLESTAIATPTSGSASSYVSGKLFKVLSNGQSFTYPIGKGSLWRPGAILSTSQSGSVTWDMEYITGAATGAVAAAPSPRNNPVSNFTSADPLVLTIATGEYWRVSDGSSSSNSRTARVGLSWGTESNVSSVQAQREAMKVMSWNGTNWTNNGGQSFATGHTQSRGTFESVSTLSFSENIVTLGSSEAANPLPVTLVSFTGKRVDDYIELVWRTESELNNDYFEVQRSSDGFEFMTIGRVEGNGTTIETHTYAFEDGNIYKGKRYYRLRQVDFDGTASLSDIILVNVEQGANLGVEVFPNPNEGEIVNVMVRGGEFSVAKIRIVDMQGKELFSTITDITTQDKMLLEASTANLPRGVYLVEVINGAERVTKRLVINR